MLFVDDTILFSGGEGGAVTSDFKAIFSLRGTLVKVGCF